MNRTRTLATLAVAGLALTACSPAADTATEPTASASGITCDKATLETKQPGKLVIATGQPTYEPWVKNDAPESGEGFEAAVAYAAAEKLGFGEADVQWIRTPSRWRSPRGQGLRLEHPAVHDHRGPGEGRGLLLVVLRRPAGRHHLHRVPDRRRDHRRRAQGGQAGRLRGIDVPDRRAGGDRAHPGGRGLQRQRGCGQVA